MSAVVFFKLKIFKKYHQSVKQLEPDQARQNVGPDLVLTVFKGDQQMTNVSM